MNERIAGKERRQSEEALFLCDLLDNLSNVAEAIKNHPNALKELSLSNIAIDALDPPASLPIPEFEHGEPAELSVSAVATSDHVAIESLSILPCDSAPIEMTNDNGLARIDNGVDVTHTDLSMLNDGLLALVPPTIRPVATTAQLLEYAKQRAPESHEVTTFSYEDDDGEVATTIQLTEIETNDNSVRSIDISVMRPHPSGKYIGTHLVLTESLLRRINNEIAHNDVERAINVEAIGDTIFDELALYDPFVTPDGTKVTIPVEPATRHHLDDIKTALSYVLAA